MMKKCADIIVDWLIGCSVVEKTEKELYSYAVYSLFLSISPLLLAIVFGIGMGCMRQSVLIILPFVIIRKFSGGYHTKHAWSCMIWSCLLLILCIILSLRVSCGWMLVFTTAGASVSLMYFSPIDNENRILSLEERIRYKKVTTILVVIFLILDFVFFFYMLYIYSICISIGIILSAGLQYPCILRKLIILIKKKRMKMTK